MAAAEENEQLTIGDGDTDICQQLMDRYANSSAAQRRHLVATAAAMRSILRRRRVSPSDAEISSADSDAKSPATDPSGGFCSDHLPVK